MSGRARTLIGLVAVVLLTMLVYAPVIGNYFSGEDFVFISWLAGGNAWYGAVQPQYYRPLPMALWALDYGVFGLDPLPYHLTNISLHALNTLLVALVARRLLPDTRVALVAAALFALYPLHPEAVTWIAGRPDLCMTAGWLAALLAALRYHENHRPLWLVASCVTYTAALFSKETAITLPLVVGIFGIVRSASSWRLPLLQTTPTPIKKLSPHLSRVTPSLSDGERDGGEDVHMLRISWPLFAGYAVVTALYVALRVAMLGGAAGDPLTLMVVARVGWNLTIGLFAAAFVPLNIDLSGETGWIVAALLALLIGAAIKLVRKSGLPRQPLIAGGIIAVISGLPGFGQPPLSLDLQQARLYYLPSVGLCLLFAVLLTAVPDAVPRLWRFSLPIMVATIFTGALLLNNNAWTEASAIVRRSIEPLSRFGITYQPGDPLIFADLPDNAHGAYIWRNGLVQAAPLFARQPLAVQRYDSANGAPLPISSRSRRAFAWRYNFSEGDGLHELFVLAQPGMFQTTTTETGSMVWDFSRCGTVLNAWRVPDGTNCVAGDGLTIRTTRGTATQLVAQVETPHITAGAWAYIELTLHASDPATPQSRQNLALATLTNNLTRRYPDWHGLTVLNDDQTRIHRVYFRPDEMNAGLLVLNFPSVLGTFTLQNVRVGWLP